MIGKQGNCAGNCAGGVLIPELLQSGIRLLQENDQKSAVGVISVARGVPGVLNRVWREIVHQTLHLAGFLQAVADILALAVHRGVDLMRDVVVALIFGESNVMCAGSDPDFLSFPCEWSLPYAEMMTAGDHRDRIGHFVSEILLAIKQI